MITTFPHAVKLWGRGQLTIPKGVRQAMHLDEETQLSVFVVGSCLILTPKRLLRASLAKEVERSMRSSKLSLEDLLKTLKQERQRYSHDTYGD
jgi:bifunctional DNA-binding transcriptional regulator/antitoxin component of YhaV-PrlF toxin-antitoxin module